MAITAAEPSSPTFSSSSSFSLDDEMYDVFLSCRCQDTRNTFTDHLYWRLKTARVDVFIDENELREGEIIPDELKQVIEQSKIAVIIFSRRYADSIRCLEVLEKIMECRRTLGRMVLPIFYHVDSKDVKKQTGSFAEAFQTHEVRFHGVKDKEEKILSWRKCLTEAAGLDGLSNNDGRFISEIIGKVTQKLKSTCLDIASKQVGIDSTMQKSSNYAEVQVVDRNMNFSSPPPPPLADPLQKKYDVFLSFRGEDTRAFTSHLHVALLRKNIDTYTDNRLEKGDDIGPTLREAIEKSKIAIVIFSKDYTSSTWCLKELIVIPIFYRINPSHVRTQQGTYALEDRPLKRSRDEVANWRAALEEAANISGFYYSSKTRRTEADFVEKVVHDVLTKLNRKFSSDLKVLVGIAEKIEKIESLLCLDSPGVCCVGIWGMGGIGKTTLADVIFHRLSSKFEACCFLPNVREKSEQTDGLKQLRNTLLGEILKNSFNINTPSIPLHIQDRLRRTKALIVLDDVNAQKQLEVLVGDHDQFCQGSRIIITARDTGPLEQKVDHANIIKSPTDEALQLSREVAEYSKGNPLALKVMGSSFLHCKSKQEWEVQWKKLKRVPIGEIHKVLRVSYNGLDDNEKEIFLDIACFHKGYKKNDLERMLDTCDFFGETGINDLIDRSLISIAKEGWSKGQIEMHDLVQEMGRKLLENNTRDGHVQAISIDWFEIENLQLKDANFEKMYQLRWLRVGYCHLLCGNSSLEKYPLIVSLDLPNSLRYLDWYKYPLKSLPSKFSAQNLLSLKCRTAKLWGNFGMKTSLEGCESLREFWELPRNTTVLDLSKLLACESLVSLPVNIWKLKYLESLDLSGCYNFQHFPEISEAMEHLEFLNLSGTAVKELHPSIGNLVALRKLDLSDCNNLEVIPDDLFRLTSLQELNLSWTEIKNIPASIKQAAQLSRLFLNGCKSLEFLPELPSLLQYLEAHACTSLRQCLVQALQSHKLDENARNNIMGDAQLRIMRLAIASSKFKEDKIEEASYNSDEESFIAITCSANEIPNWFSHQSEGSSIKIELPRDWFSTDFLGFALSLVVVAATTGHMKIGCKYNFKTSNGESHKVNHRLNYRFESQEYSLDEVVQCWDVWHVLTNNKGVRVRHFMPYEERRKPQSVEA
ncbi:Putative disease resistance TIR-NBS-LRR class protein [Prunus dulcis]|uniref:ADP-ribosyl cyclase/cyclic ADP-ribose hydrolase n=1 Tax=Prunus dulcis TaxID=3755 RepID=A0A5H2XYF1_PRUDU|nr:Putative disease resistance TIR-NBS-LRR class protein [Prunus dulcis]